MIIPTIEIGKVLLESSNMLDEKIKKVDLKTKKGEIRHIIKIDFKLAEKALDLDIEEISESTPKKYMFIGREGGPNNPQWYLTFEKCNNIISQSLPNFAGKLEDGELKDKVTSVVNDFFYDFGESVDKKYRYVLNVQKLMEPGINLIQILNEEKSNDKKNAHKNLVSKMSTKFSKYCEDKYELNKDQIGLYTICIDGKPLVQHPCYSSAIKKTLSSRLEGGSISSVRCSICGSAEKCVSNLRDISIKYYTTNQCIFASRFSQNNYNKNFVLCEKCYLYLQAAENFMENELKTKFNSYDVYVIPHVIYGKQLSGDKFRKMAEVIQPVIDISKNINDVGEYRDNVIERLEILNNEGYLFLLNFMFFKKLQQTTKIQKLIKDVQPSVFCVIQDAFDAASKPFTAYYNKAVSEMISKIKDLKTIYFMNPIKLKGGGPVQYQKLLWLYEAIFTRSKINKDVVFKNISEVFQIIVREREGYNVSSSKKEYFVFKIIEAIFYVHLLKTYGSLEGGESMDVDSLRLNDETKAYLKEMGYDEQQTAMFLLGMLIGSIGRKQTRENDEGTYKPILNKINYTGMDEARIIRLSTDVFNKLKQEKILGEYNNESIFNEYCILFSKEKDNWKLNKNESLFYLLSGYAYQTMKKKKLEE
jgi:CRISPR-associated protein Csh1